MSPQALYSPCFAGGGVTLYIRPNRISDLPVGRVASGCLLDEFFSIVLSKNNVIRYSDALAEKGFCIGQTCRPEFISGPCKPVVLTNPHPTLSLGEGVMCILKCGQNFTFSKGEGGTECRMRGFSKISFIISHPTDLPPKKCSKIYLHPKKGRVVRLFVNVFTPGRAVA